MRFKDLINQETRRQEDQTKLKRVYHVTTRLPGADGPRKFYFRTRAAAEEFEKTLDVSDGIGYSNAEDFPEDMYTG